MRQQFYDVFITHTYEDHSAFVQELVLALKKSGLRVWYLNAELKKKTSVTTSITNALKLSRYGIVIISPMFISKKWATKELGTLLSKKKIDNRILLVLCNVTLKMLKQNKSAISDRDAISSRRGLNPVLAKVLDLVAKESDGTVPARMDKHTPNRDQEEGQDAQSVGVIVLGGNAEA